MKVPSDIEDNVQASRPRGMSAADDAARLAPMAVGGFVGFRTLLYKEVLNRLETESPGTKQRFYWGFLEKQAKARPVPTSMAEKDQATLRPCATCGQPTTAETCSYCKMMARAKAGIPR